MFLSIKLPQNVHARKIANKLLQIFQVINLKKYKKFTSDVAKYLSTTTLCSIEFCIFSIVWYHQ